MQILYTCKFQNFRTLILPPSLKIRCVILTTFCQPHIMILGVSKTLLKYFVKFQKTQYDEVRKVNCSIAVVVYSFIIAAIE